MASLPSLTVNANPKLEPDLRKTTLSHDKSRNNVSYTKTQSPSYIDASLDTSFLNFREALSSFNEGTHVESSSYVSLLQECTEKRSMSNAQMVHAHIVKTGTHQDPFVMTTLINVYAKCGHMDCAQKVFDHLPKRNVVSWTGLMTGYVYNSKPEVAIRVFLDMLEVGAYPTSYTFGTILSACSSMLLVRLGKQIHAYIIKYGTECETSIGNALCSFYSKCGSLGYAIDAFRRIGDKNVISWTAVISACSDNGEPEMGLKYFVEMLSEDVELNEFTCTTVLSLCCGLHALEVGRPVHSMSIKLGFQRNLPIKNSIMYLYLKCGLIDEAHRLFDEMGSISLVTWNAMIAGHAQMMDLSQDDISAHQSGSHALKVFMKMNRSGTKPDLFTLSSVLSVCSRLVALEQGEQVHAQTIKSGFLADFIVGTALVNMYSKCGDISSASKAFAEIPTRTVISWTSMITAFAQHGQPHQALELFEEMRLAGEKPNKVTFIGVLSACSHAGMVDEALRYFDMMKRTYKIKPIMEHYACLIDMYVRLGRLEEAFDLTKKMGCEPNDVIWSILIAGSRSHGNLELGFYAAEQLLKLKPKDTQTYVMLLNMYLSAERWQDVSRVRKMMKEEKVGKLQDWSWLTIKDKVYSFALHKRSYPSKAEVESYSGTLLDELKNKGYQSQSLHVTDEEDKGEEDEDADADVDVDVVSSSTHRHSEKLAVAFGLLHSPKAIPIRIVKSISMCRDCHSFIKVVSEMTSREIIVRDNKRLHRFVNGHCSCGDFGNLL